MSAAMPKSFYVVNMRWITRAFKCLHTQKSTGFKSGECGGPRNGSSSTYP
jgi:hypothetical protein